MKTEKLTKKALKKMRDTVGKDLKTKQLEQLETILSDLAVEVAKDMATHCSKQATKLCGPHTDLASNISDEIKRQKTALIANLESLR